MRKIIITLTLSLTLGFGACVSEEQISIDGIKNVNVKGITSNQIGVEITITGSNSSASNITLKEGELMLQRGEQTIITARLKEEVQLSKRFSGDVIVPMIIKMEGGILQAGFALSQGLNAMTVTGHMKVKAGVANKTLRIENMPVDEFARQYGVDIKGVISQLL